MAAKKNRVNNKRNNSEKSYFSLSSEKKKRIAGIFLILFSIFLLLCIVSYDRRDEVYLENSIFSKIETHNWLGMLGAHLSYFFINNIIGYFSLIFRRFCFCGASHFSKKYLLKPRFIQQTSY